MKLDQHFLQLVEETAKLSNDPTTNVGAIILTLDLQVIKACNHSIGLYEVNRFKRPEKYKYFEHAERNAIYKAAKYGKSTLDGTMYTHNIPCIECARAIIQSGITTVVCYEGYSGRWAESQNQAEELLNECNIQIRKHEKEKYNKNERNQH